MKLSHSYFYRSRAFFVVSGLFLALFIVIAIAFFSVRANAASDTSSLGQRLITIHDNGSERTILTSATTLRDAFDEINMPITDADLVEPGLDEALVAKSYEVNIYRARPVTIVDGAVRKRVMSAYRTARQIATSSDMKLHDEDNATMNITTDIVGTGVGLELTIDRATPFTLVLYGKKSNDYSQATTVSDMLKEKKITLGKQDTLSVKKSSALKAGMKVEIWRNGTQTITEDQAVAFNVEQIQDADREIGYRVVKTPGVNGKKTVTYEVNMRNGSEISRKVIQTVILKQPKTQVEIVGAKASNTFDGSFGQALAKLRSCEGNYSSNTGNGYYGAYQYDLGTWGGYKGYPHAAAAPPAVQDEKAWLTYQARGWSPWPSCSISLGLQDIYR